MNKFEAKSGYFTFTNAISQRVELSLVRPVGNDTYIVRDFIPASVSWSISMTRVQALNAMRIFRLRRYHFAKYHVYKCACRRKAQP